jgi:IS1 family transposase
MCPRTFMCLENEKLSDSQHFCIVAEVLPRVRGLVEPIFPITRQRVARCISTPIQKLPEGEERLLPASAEDVLEREEVWRCVRKKAGARWGWTARSRRTHYIVAFASGNRALPHAFVCGKAIPHEYKHCYTFSAFWTAYQQVFPAETHHGVGKETGETAHKDTLVGSIVPIKVLPLSCSESKEYAKTHHVPPAYERAIHAHTVILECIGIPSYLLTTRTKPSIGIGNSDAS